MTNYIRRYSWLGLLLCMVFFEGYVGAIENPEPPEHEFTFVVLGDSQFDSPQVFNRIVEEVAQLYPSFVVQVGDLISGYTDDKEEIKRQWQRFQAQIAPLLGDIPYFPLPGNHDVCGAGKETSAELEQIYREIWGDLYYSFDYRNAHFVILDTDYQDETGRIGEGQFHWLERDLKENHHKDHIFVFSTVRWFLSQMRINCINFSSSIRSERCFMGTYIIITISNRIGFSTL